MRCVVFHGILSLNELINAPLGPAGNNISRILFETKESEELGETTVLQARLHPSQQKLFDLLGMHCLPQSPVSFKFIHPGLEQQLWYGRSSPQSYYYVLSHFC